MRKVLPVQRDQMGVVLVHGDYHKSKAGKPNHHQKMMIRSRMTLQYLKPQGLVTDPKAFIPSDWLSALNGGDAQGGARKHNDLRQSIKYVVTDRNIFSLK